MRKWQNLAAPDDEGSWYDVDGVWPTERGTYETADFLTGSSATATGAADPAYAWCAKSSSASSVTNPEYVLDGTFIWQRNSNGGAITDRTGGVTFSTLFRAQFVQYGTVTIGVLGSPRNGYPGSAWPGAATIKTTAAATNFSALAGAPQGDAICVVSNAVGIYNTDTANDGYAYSDVGDYTNWTTGEAVSGRIFFPAGPITAAVEFQDSAIVFKYNSIHRQRYVGGVVKWTTEKLFDGIGCTSSRRACAGLTGVLFQGANTNSNGNALYYWFDGANYPVCVNPLTDMSGLNSTSSQGIIVYNPLSNIFSVWGSNVVYYFDPVSRQWGKNSTPFGSAPGFNCVPVEGNSYLFGNNTTRSWGKDAANSLKVFSSSGHVGTAYVQTSMAGLVDGKVLMNQATPILRRKTDAGTQSNTMRVDFYRELHDTSSATNTTATENTQRARFDFQGSDNFARFKYSVTDYDIEIDDIKVSGRPAGKN